MSGAIGIGATAFRRRGGIYPASNFLIKAGLDKWLRMSLAESRQHFDIWSFQWGGGGECLRAAFG
jgi:hypothetical protein